MEETKNRKKQYQILDAFYKEYFQKSKINFGYYIAAGIFGVLTVLLGMIPYQYITESRTIIATMASISGSMVAEMYLTAYQSYVNGQGQVVKLYSVIKFLPISNHTICLYRTRKLFRIQACVYVVAQTVQLVFCLLLHTGITSMNILYLLLIVFLIPMLVIGTISFFTK